MDDRSEVEELGGYRLQIEAGDQRHAVSYAKIVGWLKRGGSSPPVVLYERPVPEGGLHFETIWLPHWREGCVPAGVDIRRNHRCLAHDRLSHIVFGRLTLTNCVERRRANAPMNQRGSRSKPRPITRVRSDG